MRVLKTIGYSLFLIILSTQLIACGSSKNTTKDRKIDRRTSHKTKHKTVKDTKKKEVKTVESSQPEVQYNYNTTTDDYINRFSQIAMTKMRKHKIPASITLAQGILESNSGNSTLTVGYNNHFGIKCHQNWYGDRTYYDDDEENECFRAYQNPEESYEDHALFLTQRKRYAKLFTYDITDYKSWARGLKSAGYATDRQYANKLISLIERYKLYEYDQKVMTSEPLDPREEIGEVIQTAAPSRPENGSPVNPDDPSSYHIVKQGETLEDVAQQYKMTVEYLKSINGMYDDTIYPHQRLTLVEQPKTFSEVVRYTELTQEEPKTTEQTTTSTQPVTPNTNQTLPTQHTGSIPDYHTVKQGEDLNNIAAKYGLNPALIKQYNGMLDDKVFPHMVLKLVEHPSQTISTEQYTVTHTETQPTTKTVAVTPTVQKTTNVTNTYHSVKQGETLYRIALTYGISVATLKRLNQLEDNNIQVGQQLIVSESAPQQVSETIQQQTSETPVIHTVSQGDTLYSISKQYNTSVATIKTLNNLTGNTISIGQQLKIK